MQSSNTDTTTDPIHDNLDAYLICEGWDAHRTQLIEDTYSKQELEELEKSRFFDELFQTVRKIDSALQEKAGLTKYLRAEATGHHDAPWRKRKKQTYATLADRATESSLETIKLLSMVHEQVSEIMNLSKATQIHSVDRYSVKASNENGDTEIFSRPSKAIMKNLINDLADECKILDIHVPKSLAAMADGGYATKEIAQLGRPATPEKNRESQDSLMCKHTHQLQQMLAENIFDMSHSSIQDDQCQGCVLTRQCKEIGLA
jgi:hypothetical protein